MEWLSNISFSDVMSIVTGIILLFYFGFQGFKRACGDMDWYKARQKTKKEKELKEKYEEYKLFRDWNKEERKNNFSEFYAEYRQNHKEEDEEYLKGLYDGYTEKVVENYNTTVIKKITDADAVQNSKIDKLIISSNDLLREKIIDIFYRYQPYERIPAHRKKFFLKLYDDYHGQGGNSFIDEIHEEVSKWKVVQTEEEVKGEVKN